MERIKKERKVSIQKAEEILEKDKRESEWDTGLANSGDRNVVKKLADLFVMQKHHNIFFYFSLIMSNLNSYASSIIIFND